jgi:peroxiredoxin
MSRLIEEIEKFKEYSRNNMTQEVQDIMFEATKKLVDSKISKDAPKVGDIAKTFALENANNKKICLDELLDENDFVVVNFYRGLWCPYCNLELKALQDINDELKGLKAKLLAISPQTPDESLNTKQKNELDFEVLSDLENKTAKEYGLIFSLSDSLKPVYEQFGINLPASNGDNSFELPMPGVFVINKKKEILYSFVDEDHTKRCEPQTILDIIRKNS